MEIIEDMQHSFFLNISRLIAILFCCLFLTGCVLIWPYLPVIDDRTIIKPKEINLIGTWKATPAALDDMHNLGHYDYVTPRIIILSDHTFTMKNIPDWVFTASGTSYKKLISGSGRWELTPPDESDGGYRGWGISFLPKYRWGMLMGKEPPYSLQFPLGEPDSGDVMEFEK